MAASWRSSYHRYKELFLNVSAVYKKRADLSAFLEIVLSLIAVIIFLTFALKPTILTIIALVQQIKEEEKTIQVLDLKITNLQKAGVILEQNRSFLDNIDVAVASLPSPDVFAKQIEGLSSRNDIELVNLTVDEVTLMGVSKTTRANSETKPLPGDAGEMKYSINVRGRFANIKNFLKEVENLRVISKIDNVTISSATTGSERVITAMITGRVPYLK